MTDPIIAPMSRACPRCGSYARQLAEAWEALPLVQCALCMEKYALPSWGVMTASVSATADTVELSRSVFGAPEAGLASYYSLEGRRRTLWERLRDALAGFRAGWRGEA
jgi:hypothetical protein